VQAAEIASHVSTLFEVHADRLRSSIRRRMVGVAVGAVALLGLSTVVVAASIKFVSGFAGAATAALGERAWAGDLVGGAAMLVGVSAVGALAWRLHLRRQRKATEAKYEQRRKRHVERFGPEPQTAHEPAAR
jgi:hypothetical protein